MYKLLLVEDEEIIRKGLLAKIKHHNLGISTYFEASDGIEALEIVERYVPDIVVTDIHLIQMDGLSLIERIHEKYQNIKFVIVSGYPDFSYAKKAIQFGVVRYLVKPVGLDELKDAISSCIELIEKQSYSQQEKASLQMHNDTLERIHGINGLLFSDTYAPNTPGELHIKKTEKLFPSASRFVLAAISLRQNSIAQSIFNKDDIELIRYAIINMINEIEYMGSRVAFSNIENRSQVLVLFAIPDGQSVLPSVEEYCARISAAIHQYLELSVTIFISGVHSTIDPVLLEQIQSAMDNVVLGNAGRIIQFHEGALSTKIRQEDIRYLQSCIINHYAKQLPEALGRFFTGNKGDASKLTIGYYSKLFVEIAQMIRNLRVGLAIHEEAAEELENAAKNIFEIFPDWESAEAFLQQSILRVFETSTLDMESIRNVDRIRLAQQYIDNHIGEPIGVNELAELFGLNPNYFSTLFKKEIGETVINYLTKMRMKKACQLLKTSSISVADISKMVGYENINYFYKLFKRYTGITPVEYRSHNGQ